MPIPLSCPITCSCHLEEFYVTVVIRDVQMFKDYRSYIIKSATLSKMNPPLVTQGSFMEEKQTNYLCVPCGTLSLSPVRRASSASQMVTNLPAVWETWVRSLDWEDPLKKGMGTHSSILAWRIQWVEHFTESRQPSGRCCHIVTRLCLFGNTSRQKIPFSFRTLLIQLWDYITFLRYFSLFSIHWNHWLQLVKP